VRGARAHPVWVMCRADADPRRSENLTRQGVTVIPVPTENPPDDPAAALAVLAGHGITRLLVEGGAGLATSFLRHRRADRLVWFRAAAVIGGDGLPAFHGLGVEEIADMARMRRVDYQVAGKDIFETFLRNGLSRTEVLGGGMHSSG